MIFEKESFLNVSTVSFRINLCPLRAALTRDEDTSLTVTNYEKISFAPYGSVHADFRWSCATLQHCFLQQNFMPSRTAFRSGIFTKRGTQQNIQKNVKFTISLFIQFRNLVQFFCPLQNMFCHTQLRSLCSKGHYGISKRTLFIKNIYNKISKILLFAVISLYDIFLLRNHNTDYPKDIKTTFVLLE